LKAFRSALARTLFEAGLWKLGGLAHPGKGVLFLNGGRRWCSAAIAGSKPASGRAPQED
jgi:hypothetical protein